MGSSQTGDLTCVPCIGKWILNHWTTREAPHRVFLTPAVWFFPHQAIVCGHQPGVVRFHSGLTPLEFVQTPQVTGSAPYDLPHLRCRSKRRVLGSPALPSDTATNQEFPESPSSGLLICYNDSQNSGKHLFMWPVYSMMGDTEAQPGEEALRERSRRVLSAEASVPVELGCATPHTDAFLLWRSLYFRDFYGASSRGHDPLLIRSPAPPPPQKMKVSSF